MDTNSPNPLTGRHQLSESLALQSAQEVINDYSHRSLRKILDRNQGFAPIVNRSPPPWRGSLVERRSLQPAERLVFDHVYLSGWKSGFGILASG
jgi:hypothetical protein